MADNSFKVNKSINLNPQSAQPGNPADGDIYYDSSVGSFIYYHNGFWANVDSVGAVATSANMTSAQFTPGLVQNSIIRLTGSTAGNIHGISSSFSAKRLTIYNNSTALMIVKFQSATEPTSNNRIVTPTAGDLNLIAGEIAQFVYDVVANRWALVSISSNAGAQLPASTTAMGLVKLHQAATTPSSPIVISDGDLNTPNGVVGLDANTAATITTSGGNATAITTTGSGSGAGGSFTGGSSSGPGINATGGGPNGIGGRFFGSGTGDAVQGTANGSTGHGGTFVGAGGNSGTLSTGGATSGNGLHGIGGAPNGNGAFGQGTGTGAGGVFTGGTTGGGVIGTANGTNMIGVVGQGTGGTTTFPAQANNAGGAFASNTTGPGVYGSGTGTGSGVYGQGGSSGPGVTGIAGGTNAGGVFTGGSGGGNGVVGTGTGVGSGGVFSGTTGVLITSGGLTCTGDGTTSAVFHSGIVQIDGDASIDAADTNSGTLTHSLRFGANTSGEAISSKRTSGGNQFGLDFWTNSVVRMSLLANGTVHIFNATVMDSTLQVIDTIFGNNGGSFTNHQTTVTGPSSGSTSALATTTLNNGPALLLTGFENFGAPLQFNGMFSNGTTPGILSTGTIWLANNGSGQARMWIYDGTTSRQFALV